MPAELRNIVYADVASDATISLGKDGSLTENSNIRLAGPQLRGEYDPILLVCAKEVKTEVHEYEFRHIVTFINRLSTAELNSMPNINSTPARRIEVTMFFCRMNFPDGYFLRRWLNRANSTTKKGTELDFTYVLRNDFRDTSYPYGYRLRNWAQLVADYVDGAEDGRSREEAEKIGAAFSRRLY